MLKSLSCRFLITTCVLLATGAQLAAQEIETYLSDRGSGIALEIKQGWGDFGFDVATARTGGQGSPLRIGEQTFQASADSATMPTAKSPFRSTAFTPLTRFQALVGVSSGKAERKAASPSVFPLTAK